jgi:nucleoside-diphosphate-sugar epimerase
MLFRQSAEPVVFRPSYVVGPGDGLTRALARAMAAGEVEQVGDGGYRLQPIAIADAAAAVLAAAAAPAPGPRPSHRTAVFDLVGPEPVAYAVLVGRLAAALAAAGRPARFRVRTIPVESADAAAARGGYQGMAPDELDCLLCDELADPTPLAGLLGRSLTPLDEALSEAVAGPA